MWVTRVSLLVVVPLPVPVVLPVWLAPDVELECDCTFIMIVDTDESTFDVDAYFSCKIYGKGFNSRQELKEHTIELHKK
jgi:hypothetical protein